MANVHLTITQETEQALLELAEIENKPVSNLIREALQMYLDSKGKDIDTRVRWGGPRKKAE